MVLYEWACPEHGRFEAFAAAGSMALDCPRCGEAASRRFSVPVTDCASFGKNMMPARTKPTDRKPHNDMQEEIIHGLQKRDRTHIRFGAGKQTGS